MQEVFDDAQFGVWKKLRGDEFRRWIVRDDRFMNRALSLLANYATKLPNFAPKLISRTHRPLVHFIKTHSVGKISKTARLRLLIARLPNDFSPLHHAL